MTSTLTVDDLQFEVRRSERRTTVEIIVDRGGELVVQAPAECPAEFIETFIRQKRFWIYQKLALKESLRQPVAGKEFINGEGFPYLGNNYRLLIVASQNNELKLDRGRFKLRRAELPEARACFIRWYSERAQCWLLRRIERFTPRMGVEPKGLAVQDLGFRWGSCGKGGALYFHWAVILLPPSFIDYLLVHELAHLHEPRHTPGFWARVERAMPDYEARRSWLQEHGGRLIGL